MGNVNRELGPLRKNKKEMQEIKKHSNRNEDLDGLTTMKESVSLKICPKIF